MIGQVRYVEWKYLKNESEWKEAFGEVRVHNGYWDGEGNYAISSYSQKCPRGCCYDDVLEIRPAYSRELEIKEAMQKLAQELKEAKQKGVNNE